MTDIAVSEQQESTATQPEQHHGALEYTQSILGQRIRCVLDDGRTATGRFSCIDRLKNVILTNVIEERTIQTRDYTYEPNISTVNKEMTVRRELGQAMIPGSRLVKVEIAKSIHDEKIGRILHNSNKLPINRPVV